MKNKNMKQKETQKMLNILDSVIVRETNLLTHSKKNM